MQPSASSENSAANKAFFLSPEPPVVGTGGGGLRSASLLEYLRTRYEVQVAGFELPFHSKSLAARAWRNGVRFLRGIPPLLDRYSGFESQLDLRGRYALGVVEHFWCAPYAAALRPHCDRVVLDLHNIESELARTHAEAAGGVQRILLARFAESYRKLERKWITQYDAVLVTSAEDRGRVDHPNVLVYPNALPELPKPEVAEEDCIVFSGNLEYHPNIEAVRWFHSRVWPSIRNLTHWRLIGRNPRAIASIVGGDDRIQLIGPVQDAVTEIARAKVCVVPLRSGSGTRFKILEAWAAARAVVSTTLGAEGLGARNAEHLAIADDPEIFAGAIARLLKDPAERTRLGDSGRSLYLSKFTWPCAWRSLDGL